MDDESLSIYEQKTVDDAVAELQAAKDGLTEKSGSGDEGEGDEGDGGDHTGDTGDGSEGNGGQQGSGPDSGSQSGGAGSGSGSGSGADAPKTGDAAAPFGLMAAAVLAGVAAAGTAAYRRKRR